MNANKKQTIDKTRSRAIFRVFWALLGLFALFWQSAAAQVTPDVFEVDNSPQEANFLNLNDPHGPHNFHEPGDEDWVRLVNIQGQAEDNPYRVTFDTTDNLDPSDIVWELFNSAKERLDIGTNGDNFNWPTMDEDFFFIRITHRNSEFFGAATYTITIIPSPVVSTVVGIVRNKDTGEPLPGVTITVQETGVSTTSNAGVDIAGLYSIMLGDISDPAQVYTLKANRDGFLDKEETLSNIKDVAIELNISLQPEPGPIGPIFEDVPPGYWAEDFIEKIFDAGITSGCSQNPRRYCPGDPVTRAEMAVFLERGINGSDYDPPGATGIFDDVLVGQVTYWAADWVEQFYADGITSGCSEDPLLYCPDELVTRAEMAVFLLRSMYGEDYTPPSAVGIFEDVPVGQVTYWAANWVEQFFNDGITSGCSTDPPLYCPDDLVTRAMVAVFMVRAFGL